MVPPAFPRPGVRDWAFLATSLGFVGAGFVLLPSERDGAIVTIAFFGACALVAGSTVVRKLRFHRLRPIHAEIAGGVPIRPARSAAGSLGAALLLLGSILVVFGRGHGLVFWAIAWFIALVGAVVLLGVVTGRLPVGYVKFDAPGITLGRRRWSFTIPWDRIARLAPGEFHDNPVLLLWVDEPGAVRAHPAEYQPRVEAELVRSYEWVGAHVMLMTSQYGLDLPLLMRALERYVADPSSRSELSRPKLPGA